MGYATIAALFGISGIGGQTDVLLNVRLMNAVRLSIAAPNPMNRVNF